MSIKSQKCKNHLSEFQNKKVFQIDINIKHFHGDFSYYLMKNTEKLSRHV